MPDFAGKIWVVCIDCYTYSESLDQFHEMLKSLAWWNAAESVGQQRYEYGKPVNPKKYTNEPLEGRWFLIAVGYYCEGSTCSQELGVVTQEGEFKVVPLTHYEYEWDKT